MGEKLVIGPIQKGLKTTYLPFNIDNDSFPTLINSYQWRDRVKRKRGTQLLGRLSRYIGTTNGSTGDLTVVITPSPAGSVSSYTDGTNIYTDATGTASGTVDLISTGTGTATLTYSGGVATLAITGGAKNAAVLYYPSLPVMGLEDLAVTSTQFPGTLAFDTDYSYNISTSYPYVIDDVTFYKNATANSTTLPSYVPKGAPTPFYWNGQDYRQFWTTNYEGALWATNGTNAPFDPVNCRLGMQFAPASTISTVTVTVTQEIHMTITNCPLIIGDMVFLNEWITGTPANELYINFQTGYVTACSPNTLTPATKTLTIFLPFTNLQADTYTPGIVQYLTNSSNPNVDCLRWYDGDPSNGAIPPSYSTGLGWVNFMPPLSQEIWSVAGVPQAKYYLIGARLVVPFKDRLIFMGIVIQTSTGSPIYLQDTIAFSQNGTPYYTASFSANPTFVTTEFNPILTPLNQGATPNAWWEDQTGYGGYQSVGLAQPITTAFPNQDVMIVGLSQCQTRLIYTANDFAPFSFFLINSELGTSSTFSGVIMDKGIFSRGARGFVFTSQTNADRFDADILDQNFEINLQNNGTERITAQRDYINEWIYFTYSSDKTSQYNYPTQTLLFNYRDNTWAIFNESYTTYGQFRKVTGQTWATIGIDYPTWSVWNDPWDAGISSLDNPQVIAGNTEGYIVIRAEGTDEANSLYIQNISSNVLTVPNHCLNQNDWIIINNVVGTVGYLINGRPFQVQTTTQNTITITGSLSGTYLGGGTIQRLYKPNFQTKQFPMAWSMGRKTRIGPQMYMLTTTPQGQITLQIFLSQDASNSYSFNNDALMYSQVLYTCPESVNLGLTPYNTNLQQLTNMQTGVSPSQQIWHRVNNSLIGDTVQLGFTISDPQMSLLTAGNFFAITGATNANPCVLTCTGSFSPNQLLEITGVQGMTQLNFNGLNLYSVISSTSTTVTIGVDSTSFGTYTSGGVATIYTPQNATAEVELHGIILDVTASQVLA